MTTIEEYYNKFHEEKRLNTRHGRVEFITSMKYIHKYIDILKDELKAAGKEAEKHSVRHYKDKFIKISQKIYFVYLFFRVSGTNVL